MIWANICQFQAFLAERNIQPIFIAIHSAQSSLSIFAQKYVRKCKDIHFILQNKYHSIYKGIF